MTKLLHARAISRGSRASSAAFRPAARWPPRSRSPRRRTRAAFFWRCCPTRASATYRRCCSKAWKPARTPCSRRFHDPSHSSFHARRRWSFAEVTTMSNVQSHNLQAQSVSNSPAGRYDQISRSIADAIEHAVERLQPKSGERILDLATGTGWGSRVISQRFPRSKLTGADIAEQMLDHARSAAAAQKLSIDYQHADAEQLPFPDGAFDGVVSTFGVMFVGRPEAAAGELARVVRKGGRVVLATWKSD